MAGFTERTEIRKSTKISSLRKFSRSEIPPFFPPPRVSFEGNSSEGNANVRKNGTRISGFHAKYLIGCRSAEASSARKEREKGSAKLESAEAGSDTRRDRRGCGVERGREESRGCFPPFPIALARIQRKSNDRLHDRFCLPDNRLVAELIYTCTGRKSGIWFTAKIPSDKGAAGERVQPGRDDKFIRLQCSCTTTPLPPLPSSNSFLFSRYLRVPKRTSLNEACWEFLENILEWDLVSIDLQLFEKLFVWSFVLHSCKCIIASRDEILSCA